MDLRERIVAACASGETAASVAQRFGVCSRTVQRYVERARRDALVPTPIPGRPPRLAREQLDEAHQKMRLAPVNIQRALMNAIGQV